jgi:FlaA1/EpsC-like NDP-sugar epimerase
MITYRKIAIRASFIVADVLLVTLALWAAYLVRFDFSIWPYYQGQAQNMIPILVLIRLAVFYYARVYQFVWKYSGINELMRIARAIGWGSLIWVSIDFLRNYRVALILGVVLCLSAVIHRLFLRNWIHSRIHRIWIAGVLSLTLLTLLGGVLFFTQFYSAPVSIYDSTFVGSLIPQASSYELGVPRAVLILEGILSFLLLGCLRMAPRIWAELRFRTDSDSLPVIIIGAGDWGENVLRAIKREPNKYRIVGFVDEEPAIVHSSIHGVEVLGTPKRLGDIIVKHEVAEVLVAKTDIDRGELQEVLTVCEKYGVIVRKLPEITDFSGIQLSVDDLHQININDLLGRPEVKLDAMRITAFIKDKVVLITGAGGSIGSELCRQIGGFSPARIIFLGKGEASIYNIEMEMRGLFPHLEIVSLIGDIRNRTKVRQIFRVFKPDIVFHAAAHKHVPFMERDVDEAISVNVFGTRNLIQAAAHFHVGYFVQISTDKAVKPSSVMGCSKRLAELLVQRISETCDSTHFFTVRFGNVLGSRGSVVPLFEKQIRQGGPITVTHPDMTRYFMSIPEAVRLVLHSTALGKNGSLCILDMGKPVRIVDLAENMIRMVGLKPHEDIEIVFTGPRLGEKLYEELVTDEQAITMNQVGKIMICQPVAYDWNTLDGALAELEDAVQKCDQEEIITILARTVPGYKPDAMTLAESKRMKVGK